MLKVNEKAPLFTLKNQDGSDVSLTDYLGKKVILYFYPQDFTSGCTLQAKGFASHYDAFKERGYTVIGISKDSVESHQSFCSAHELPFILLSDPTAEVRKAYHVMQDVVYYGDIAVDTRRSTFVINEKGIITHIFYDVDPKTSAVELLNQI